MAAHRPLNMYPSPNLSHRSEQSQSQSQRSLRSQASMRSTSNGIPIIETRGLEAAHILDQLQKEIIFLTGGRDRQGGPLLIFPPHRDEYFLPNDIAACLRYLVQIPSDESKRRGFTAIIDSRDGSWSNLVTLLGCLKQSLGDYLKQVLVLRSDGMGQRQSSTSSSFRRDRGPNIEGLSLLKEYGVTRLRASLQENPLYWVCDQPQFINLNRLYTYVDRNQLIGSMGGTLMYRHSYWLQNRLDLEKFIRESRAAASHLDTAEMELQHRYRVKGPESPTSPVEALRQHQFFQDSTLSVPKQVIRDGHDLLQKLQQYNEASMHGDDAVTTLDNLEAQKQVKRTLQYIENRLDKLQNFLEDQDRSLHMNVLRDDVQKEFRQVVEWILGPGEKLLASQADIGDSFETAEALRKRHEELEIKCTDTYGHYAELRHRAEDLVQEHHTSSGDIRAQRDYMDTVCRSFASRLERRRILLITSVRFHRLTEEFTRKLDDLLGFLYDDKEADTVELAQEALRQLQEKVDAIDTAASHGMRDGQSLLDEMSRPIKNAFGKDISPDYAHQIKHITQKLEELQERKMRCDDLAEVRKLKLQQTLQLRTCERDVDQALNWILELYDVMITSHTNLGQTLPETETLQEEHRRFESTASGTYEYGKQLLQAAHVLRRSLRFELEPYNVRVQKLEDAWGKFSTGTNERANRLTVAAMFIGQSDKVIEGIEQLMVVVAQTLTGDISVNDALSRFGPEKQRVEMEHQDTDQMGKALLERLALPVIAADGMERPLSQEDQGANEMINSRLRKMDHKIMELNRYWSEMEQTGQPPSVQPKITRSFQQFPQGQSFPQGQPYSQGQRSATLPQRSQSQRGQDGVPFKARDQPSRTQSLNKPESQARGRFRKRPVSKHDSRRSTGEFQPQVDRNAKLPSDKMDKVQVNGHPPSTGIHGHPPSVPDGPYHSSPDIYGGQASQPHVSQSYYPRSEEFLPNIPSSSYSDRGPAYQPSLSDDRRPQTQPDMVPAYHPYQVDESRAPKPPDRGPDYQSYQKNRKPAHIPMDQEPEYKPYQSEERPTQYHSDAPISHLESQILPSQTVSQSFLPQTASQSYSPQTASQSSYSPQTGSQIQPSSSQQSFSQKPPNVHQNELAPRVPSQTYANLDPKSLESLHSQILPDSSSQQHLKTEPKVPTLEKDNSDQQKTASTSHLYMKPDTLPKLQTYGQPDIMRSNLPSTTTQSAPIRKHYSKRVESDPISFKDALLKFAAPKHEEPVETEEKKLVQAELNQVLKTRANIHEELRKEDMPRGARDLKNEMDECGEWIRVRVHQMEPDLMEVGSTLEEALQLQQEHDQLLSKLQAKEEEIKQLLSRADSYAADNQAEATVYSAMSDTLAEAWRDLNDKLDYRRRLLAESVNFHQKANLFATQMEQAQSRFLNLPFATDVESARRQLRQHQEIKQDILETSKSTLDLGHSLLERIKEMGMHADFTNRHATTAACYGIEHLLELLQDRRRRLEELWEQRRFRLEQSLQLFQLDQEVDKVLGWYRTTGHAQLKRTELGNSYESARLIQEDHHRFEQEARDIQDTVLRLVRTADQLLRRTHLDAEGVRQRLQAVDEESENFMVKLDTRRKNISTAMSFFGTAETALTRLEELEVQITTSDLPRNSAELQDRHSQLSNVIVEVSTSALSEGRLLLERVSRDDFGADGVRRRMQDLEDCCTRLESLCKARRAEAWERSQAFLSFQESYTSLQTWVTQIVLTRLSQHSNMGTTLTEGQDFLEIHEHLEEDISDKSAELKSLSEAVVSLVKSGDQEANSAAEKVDHLTKQIQRLHRVTETRIKLSLLYVSFHRLLQQNSNCVKSLEHILKSETENLQDLTDAAVHQTEELWSQVESTFHDLEDKGREFLKNSSTIADDETLQVRHVISTVEYIMTETREHMTHLTTQWESWQTHVSTSRQFKSQWHQFIQDARKSIDKVLKLENDFFPVLAGDLGSSMETANEYQRRLDNFMPEFETIDQVMVIERDFFAPYIAGYLGDSLEQAQELQSKLQIFEPTAKKATAEIEEHLKTAEMLSLKGDTRGQKEQIMNELIKVHQRFQARIHEYQILLKMTIQFFKNLDQLDKLIERTEQEYLESELPSDLNRAENMLEEHKRKKQEISHLINYTADEGEKIVVRVRQTDAEAVAKDDIQRVLGATEEYKHRWNSTWEEQERRLRQNLQICQFNFDLRQIHSEIDELHQHLQARRGSYGNTLPAAKMTSQAFKQFEMTVELIEKKINNFTDTAELMVQDKHYDSVHIRREIDMLNTKWTTFHTSVHDYREMLDVSIIYFALVEESEQWMSDANNVLMNIGMQANECRTPEDANELLEKIHRYVDEGRPVQDERMSKMSELAEQLYGDEGPTRVHNLYVQYQDLIQNFQQADNEVTRLKQNLEQQGPGFEEFTPMDVTVTAEAPPRPPRITQHLKNAEVMEGTKVIFEVHIESEITVEVKWFKDNLPLNSPDYETRHEGNVASLTIEETFSEDTARYTIRVSNMYGEVESSAYLHVKETHQQIIPPDFSKNLKSVDALEGSPFAFECHVMGIPSPTISWYKDEINIDNSPEYVITKINGTCCLKIRKIMHEHSARYTCRAINPGGEAASSARLTVIPAQTPIIQQELKDVAVAEGKGIRLEVVFSASPAPEVTWYRGIERILPSNMYTIMIDTTRSALDITEAYPEDSGNYSVIIRNQLGEVRSTCQVTVESFYSSAAEEMSQASTEQEPMPPSFMQLLAPTREVMEGSRVRLDCVLVGHPEPEVIWFHNEKPVKESTDIQLLFEGDRCTLVIREAYLEDAGEYKVAAKNDLGFAESSCKLHVEPLSELSDASIGGEITPPKFTQLLRDVTTFSGQRVCLQCRVQGHPLPTVQWFRDNKPIESSPDYQVTAFADVHNLTIPEAFEQDGGKYMVKAANKAGEAKCYAKLVVKPAQQPATEQMLRKAVEPRRAPADLTHSPPEFIRLFQDKVSRPGDAVTFDCLITGAPKPKVSWFINGEPVVSQDYQITMEGDRYALHIPEVFDEDAGRFSVTAENPSGKATCSAMLHVEEPVTDVVPVVKSRTFESKVGKQYSSTETLTTTETVHSFTVQSEKERPQYIPSLEQHSTTLVTEVPSKYDVMPEMKAHEHYATTITTDLQPKYQPVDLTISVPIPPKFLEALKTITALEGTKVTFEGVVTGKPEPTIKWYKEGKNVTDSPDFEISYREGRVKLMIPETFPEDAGKYSCTASNVGGTASSTAELIVRASVIPPAFTERLYNISIKEGEPVKLTVRVAGSPAPVVTWFREGSQIVSSPDFEIIQEGDIHSLYIPEVFYKDAGKFEVKAENVGGQAHTTANLNVEGRPLAEIEEEEQKPVSEARERFEPARAPGVKTAPWKPQGGAPPAKVSKVQRPVEAPKPKKFTEHMEMQVEDKPKQQLPEFQRRIPLFGIPVEEEAPKKEKPEEKKTSAAEMRLPRFGVPVETPPPSKQTIVMKDKPKVTKPLRSQTVKEGEKVKFDVKFKGRPEPIVKWFRDDSEIQSSTDFEISYSDEGTSLSIPEVFPEDAGRYKCMLTNADGSEVTEAKLTVLPSGPVAYQQIPISEEFIPEITGQKEERIPSPIEAVKPMFIERLQNSLLVPDTNIIFECYVSGQPFPEIYWFKGDKPLKPDARHRIDIDHHTGRCTLIVTRCRPEDIGEYTCNAVNIVGETSTSAALIPVETKEPLPPPLPASKPPTLPFDQEVLQRSIAPRRTEKDFFIPRSNKILESNMDYRMAQPEETEYHPVTDEEPSFQASHFEDRLREEIQYRDGKVRFTSDTETSEYDSEVPDDRFTANMAPEITQRMKDFHLIEGADATFVCRISGKPRPKVAWYKDGHRVKRSNRYDIKYDRDGFCTLRIRVALPEDAGHYTVLAVNSLGKDTCSSQLLVEGVGTIDATSFVAPETLDRILRRDNTKDKQPQDVSGVFEQPLKPIFKKIPDDIEVREGNMVRFDTVITGRPAPELAWYCNERKVYPDDHHKMVVNEDGVHSLIITKASPQDGGIYNCIAKNKGGESAFTVDLRVLEREQMQPPKFVERMQNYTIKEGQSVTLTARAVGTPTPMISWQKNNKMITPNKDYKIEIDNGRSSLLIEDAKKADAAWYQCSAVNVAGTASTRAKLVVQPEPVKRQEPEKKVIIQPRQQQPDQQRIQSPQYEIQAEGPVQEISYVKNGDSALLRLVKEEDLSSLTRPGFEYPESPDRATFPGFPKPPPPTPLCASVEASPELRRKRMIPYQRLDQAVPMEIPLESEEEGKAPTVSEARAKFDQVEGVPPKKVSRMEIQPVGPAAAPLAPKVLAKPKAPVPTPVPETMPRKVVPPVKKPTQPKSPSPSYDIQEEGPVQQITYVSDTERGTLRFVSEDELDYPREDKPKPSGEAIDMDLEETKLLTLTEARARFDVEESVPKTKVSKAEIKPKSLPFVPLKPEAKPEEKAPVPKPVPEFIPKKVVPPVKKPSAPKPFPKPEKVAPEGIKSPSPSYEIQEEGPVQQISYVSDKESGYLRIVTEVDQADTRVNKAQPAMVPMEDDKENTLPTMTEAIAIFEKQEVPVKLGPAPIEVLPKNLPSAQILSKIEPKTNTDRETAVPETIPQKLMPPAKTLADALKPFILPEKPFLEPKLLGDAIQVDGPAVVPMSLEVDEESTLPTMTEAIAIFEKQEVPVKLGPAPIEVLPKNLPSAQNLSKMEPKAKTDREHAVPEATPQKLMPPAKTLADALKPFILPEKPFLEPKLLGDAIQVDGPIHDVSFGQRTDRDKGLGPHRIVPGEELNYSRYGNGCSIMF